MGWPRRRWEVWVVWFDERGNRMSERCAKRCWTSAGAAAVVSEKENSTTLGAFVAGTALAGKPYVPGFEVRDTRLDYRRQQVGLDRG